MSAALDLDELEIVAQARGPGGKQCAQSRLGKGEAIAHAEGADKDRPTQRICFDQLAQSFFVTVVCIREKALSCRQAADHDAVGWACFSVDDRVGFDRSA